MAAEALEQQLSPSNGGNRQVSISSVIAPRSSLSGGIQTLYFLFLIVLLGWLVRANKCASSAGYISPPLASILGSLAILLNGHLRWLLQRETCRLFLTFFNMMAEGSEMTLANGS